MRILDHRCAVEELALVLGCRSGRCTSHAKLVLDLFVLATDPAQRGGHKRPRPRTAWPNPPHSTPQRAMLDGPTLRGGQAVGRAGTPLFGSGTSARERGYAGL